MADPWVNFGERGATPVVKEKLIKETPIRRVQTATTVVFCIRIMIRDSFPAQIVVGTHHSPRNMLRAAVIYTVVKWLALVMLGLTRGNHSHAKGAEHDEQSTQSQTVSSCDKACGHRFCAQDFSSGPSEVATGSAKGRCHWIPVSPANPSIEFRS